MITGLLLFLSFIHKPMLKKLLCILLLCPILYGCNNGGNETSTNQGLCQRESLTFDPVIFQQNGFHLFVIGDTGTGDNNQQDAANSLESYHLSYPLDGISIPVMFSTQMAWTTLTMMMLTTNSPLFIRGFPPCPGISLQVITSMTAASKRSPPLPRDPNHCIIPPHIT